MPRWSVSYSEKTIREIVVTADTEEEAENMVLDGDVDYDASCEIDAEILGVNSVEFLDDSEVGDDDE